MNTNEDMREEARRMWNIHHDVMCLLIRLKVGPRLMIFMVGYMLLKYEMASFQRKAQSQKALVSDSQQDTGQQTPRDSQIEGNRAKKTLEPRASQKRTERPPKDLDQEQSRSCEHNGGGSPHSSQPNLSHDGRQAH